MTLTKDFKETIMTRAKKDKKFREAMLTEAINELLTGDVDAGKAMIQTLQKVHFKVVIH